MIVCGREEQLAIESVSDPAFLFLSQTAPLAEWLETCIWYCVPFCEPIVAEVALEIVLCDGETMRRCQEPSPWFPRSSSTV